MVNFRQQVLKPLGSYITVFRALDALPAQYAALKNKHSLLSVRQGIEQASKKRLRATLEDEMQHTRFLFFAFVFCPLPFQQAKEKEGVCLSLLLLPEINLML